MKTEHTLEIKKTVRGFEIVEVLDKTTGIYKQLYKFSTERQAKNKLNKLLKGDIL